MPKAVLVVATNCPPGREAEFNDWYTGTHVPDILKLPGMVAATRYEIVGQPRSGQGRFLALYEIESEDPAATMSGVNRAVPGLAAKGRMFAGLQLAYAATYQPITERLPAGR